MFWIKQLLTQKAKSMKNDFMMHLVIVGGIILVFSLILKIIGVTFLSSVLEIVPLNNLSLFLVQALEKRLMFLSFSFE